MQKKYKVAGARLLRRCKVQKKVIEKVVWCRCKVTRPERVKWQWVKSGERHSTVGSGDTREEEAKITTRKRNSTSTSSTDYQRGIEVKGLSQIDASEDEDF